ncbi:pre-rRNA 2'-O-ribose RNA methyltransferase FTSJ3 isoform X2 [Oncorhynchus mykiss]|uniref:pre-rRNA 2'-O-ribose RNA methyltransferase FTSJ3 isoform X2 n=1 Tax=Oncorhynchus mykiss TaxID=8022 RepID=UPI001878F1C6|nr:pre-rRNA 2'-O-ribose RNA methyltransferase FTSJ3 isoform X2 [Oncorhynchus mykiss]
MKKDMRGMQRKDQRERGGKKFVSSEDQCEVLEWFVDDEKKHRNKPILVTKEMVEENKAKWKEINARPIKRVAEAKARKKSRMLKKMESAKKKAEAVVSTVDIGEREKMAHLKRYCHFKELKRPQAVLHFKELKRYDRHHKNHMHHKHFTLLHLWQRHVPSPTFTLLYLWQPATSPLAVACTTTILH